VNRTHRIVLLVGLVCTQCTLLVWFAGVGYEGNTFPRGEELTQDYNTYIGDEAVVYGQVRQTNPLFIEYDHNGRAVEFQVTGVDNNIKEGQYLEVYATVQRDRVLTAIDAVIYAEQGHWYAYGISVLAVLLTGGRLFKHWEVNVKTFSLKKRDDA
jgi:hypothetical protein